MPLTPQGPVGVVAGQTLTPYDNTTTFSLTQNQGMNQVSRVMPSAQAFPGDVYYTATDGSLPTLQGYLFAQWVQGPTSANQQVVAAVLGAESLGFTAGVLIVVQNLTTYALAFNPYSGAIFAANSTVTTPQGGRCRALIRWDTVNPLSSGAFIEAEFSGTTTTITTNRTTAFPMAASQRVMGGKSSWDLDDATKKFLGTMLENIQVGRVARALGSLPA